MAHESATTKPSEPEKRTPPNPDALEFDLSIEELDEPVMQPQEIVKSEHRDALERPPKQTDRDAREEAEAS